MYEKIYTPNVFLFYIWEVVHVGICTLRWIDVSSYIYSKENYKNTNEICIGNQMVRRYIFHQVESCSRPNWLRMLFYNVSCWYKFLIPFSAEEIVQWIVLFEFCNRILARHFRLDSNTNELWFSWSLTNKQRTR